MARGVGGRGGARAMAKTGERRDPEIVSLFHVEIEGIDGAAFSKCSGLKTETEVYELQEGGENSLVRKLIGQSRASNIVLTSRFFNAIPVRWEMGEFDSMGSAAQCEILELAVESIKKGT